MHLFISKEKTRGKLLSGILPVAFLILIVLLFYLAVAGASARSEASQQRALEKALLGGAIRTYALTGAYPQSLEELLSDYRITYDASRFIVEYTPTGSNLLPSIFVLPVRKGGAQP